MLRQNNREGVPGTVAGYAFVADERVVLLRRLLQKSTVSQSCWQDCPDFAERIKRKALRVRSEGSIPPYVTEAESRKQHSDSPLCNGLRGVDRKIERGSLFV